MKNFFKYFSSVAYLEIWRCRLGMHQYRLIGYSVELLPINSLNCGCSFWPEPSPIGFRWKWTISVRWVDWNQFDQPRLGLGMHRTRTQTGNLGFGHSRYLNARLSYSYTLVHIRHQSEPGLTESELPGNDRTQEVRSGACLTRTGTYLMWMWVRGDPHLQMSGYVTPLKNFLI